ncbi:MAG: ABC transporter ATP-binding protein [Planctomycetes bacterium]|nr:ABC transporter ATP-binding protein [Planctomycetota bacterium]
MTDAQANPGPPAAPGAEPERGVTLRDFFALIGRGIRRNRGLFAAMLATASLEAFFTKAPFLLIKPLFDAIAPQSASGAPAAPVADPTHRLVPAVGSDLGQQLTRGFMDFAIWLRDLLGIEFSGNADGKAVVLACAVVAAGLGLLGGVAIYLSTLLSRYFASKIVVELRDELAAHILRLPLRFFGRRRMGELISRLTNDTMVLSRSFTLMSDHVVVDPLMVLGNVIIVGSFTPWALVLFLPAIPLMALPMIRLGRKVHRRSRGSLAAMGDSTESMNQMLSGIKVVKAFQLEEERLRDFSSSNAEYLHRTRRMLQAKGRSQATVFITYQLAFAGIVVMIGWLMLVGRYDIGTISMVLLPISTTYQHVKRLARVYNQAMESLGALDGVESILREDFDDGHRGGRPIEVVTGRVELQSVSFAYGEDPVLRDCSFAVEPGTTVALVGPSGAGKSTCLDLVARFHDPTAGRILIDGQDLRELELASFRRHIAMVAQQPFLFNATIRENIACGRPGATMDDVVQAATLAQIHDFVLTLPKGYETLCGERGSNLSGGQMQRITVARAIVRDPAILFLDEATSALDSESEEAVQRALNELMRGRTSFVIAHRLSTIRGADLILVFDRGRIVERGTHAELTALGGLYARMVELQEVR